MQSWFPGRGTTNIVMRGRGSGGGGGGWYFRRRWMFSDTMATPTFVSVGLIMFRSCSTRYPDARAAGDTTVAGRRAPGPGHVYIRVGQTPDRVAHYPLMYHLMITCETRLHGGPPGNMYTRKSFQEERNADVNFGRTRHDNTGSQSMANMPPGQWLDAGPVTGGSWCYWSRADGGWRVWPSGDVIQVGCHSDTPYPGQSIISERVASNHLFYPSPILTTPRDESQFATLRNACMCQWRNHRERMLVTTIER